MKGSWVIMAGVGLLLLGWAAWPRAGRGQAAESSSACQARLRALFAAMSIYAEDHDDRLPEAAKWGEAISDYLGKVDDLRCPSAKTFGYAFHLDLQGARLNMIPAPSSSAVVFDSDNLRENAADNLQSFPQPPRHIDSNGESGNNALYADGHAALLTSG